MKNSGFIIFFIVVLSLYSFANYQIIQRGCHSLELFPVWKKYFLYLTITLSFCFVISKILQQFTTSYITIFLEYVGSFWLGAIAYSLIVMLFIDLFRLIDYFFPFFPDAFYNNYAYTKYIVLLISVCLIAVLLTIGYVNDTIIRTKTLKLEIQKKAVKYSEINIVTFSDVHLGAIHGKKRLEKIINKVNGLNADIVLIAGDIADQKVEYILNEDYGYLFEEIKSKFGVYYIPGNHDYYGNFNELRKYLQKHKIELLIDATKLIDNSFYIIGRDDREGKRASGKERKSLKELTKNLNHDLPIILVDHQPWKLQEAANEHVDLQISGHTHYGQMFPFNLITNLIFEKAYGYIQKEKTHIYVTSGAGSWGPPVRLGTVPEVVKIHLQFEN